MSELVGKGKVRIYKVREQFPELVRPVIGGVIRMVLTVRSPDVNMDEQRKSDVGQSQADVSWNYTRNFCAVAAKSFTVRHPRRHTERGSSEGWGGHPVEL